MPPKYFELVIMSLIPDIKEDLLQSIFYLKAYAHNGRRAIESTMTEERLRFVTLAEETCLLELDKTMNTQNVPEDEFVVLILELAVKSSVHGYDNDLYLGWIAINPYAESTVKKKIQINAALISGPGKLISNAWFQLDKPGMYSCQIKFFLFGPRVFIQNPIIFNSS